MTATWGIGNLELIFKPIACVFSRVARSGGQKPDSFCYSESQCDSKTQEWTNRFQNSDVIKMFLAFTEFHTNRHQRAVCYLPILFLRDGDKVFL